MDARQVWQAALERIRTRVSAGAYTTWFHGTVGIELTAAELVVAVSNTFARGHLRQRFLDTITRAVGEVAGRNLDVAFVIGPTNSPRQQALAPATTDMPPQDVPMSPMSPMSPISPVSPASSAAPRARNGGKARPRARLATRTAVATEPRPAPLIPPSAAQPPLVGLFPASRPSVPTEPPASPGIIARTPVRSGGRVMTVEPSEITGPLFDLHPRYRFDTFVVGTANRLAYAAAEEICRAPGLNYNPLLLFGGAGLGKTHLLHAIGHRARAAGLVVAYITAERFTNEIIEAIRQHTTNEFRRRYRAVDVLLMDDVQFIAGRESTEEEFFHTFNALHEANKQIVLTSDRIPRAMRHLHERLRSRFAWGLMADIHPPDFSHRLEILRAKAAAKQLNIADDVLAYLARPECESVRTLEGLLTRAVAHAQMLGEPLDIGLAKRILAPIASVPAAPRKLGHDEVLAAVADHFNLTMDALRGKSREHQTAWARQMAMYLLREETGASLHEIGGLLGGRDHTTIMHGVARITQALANDARTRQDLAAIRSSLRG